ncbi:FAD-binding oxidoreductase [Vibrio sinensis]|uniref:FAD-binding oxidoreductase n=1 Tax=Vibrio sinensis TaxID=2302434 RepID=A0A3A6R308_9VIBR|nr:FAD-dependent oxidoreductase [Vibrio sinensis]RJX75527.1 FAD-binding oxidoreductase [Vibrio sinensis]
MSPNISPTVAVIGGGISGATAALHLAELGLNITLIEKNKGLVSGPPICHLHAGGNLYREISVSQCIELLKQSIDSVRLFPHTINQRPTIIAVPHTDGGDPNHLLERLDQIKSCYAQLVERDPRNKVIGEPEDYYRLIFREELDELATRAQPSNPQTIDDWLIPFAKHTDLDGLKYPVVAVQEYGWSVFRIAATTSLALEALPNCTLLTESKLLSMTEKGDKWELTYSDREMNTHSFVVDYVINACGYETGNVDDMAKLPRRRMVEFKAAYVTQWQQSDEKWPEVIFHGPRGSVDGMAQLTPYVDGTFQLHGMTKDITLFDDGLVSSCQESSQPKLPQRLINKINNGWREHERLTRSERAIRHMSRFIPDYATATEYGVPLFGAQQIPGDDETLRAADVTFSGHHYARIEVVKGSSAYEAVRKVVSHWGLFDYKNHTIEELHPKSQSMSAQQVECKACQLATERGYPVSLAKYYGSEI